MRGEGTTPGGAGSIDGSHMTIAQVNLHRAMAASVVISNRFISDNLGALLIQEPWAFRGEVKGLLEKDRKNS